ncbi:MAG: site-specific integrase [Bacteroidales bacterium]
MITYSYRHAELENLPLSALKQNILFVLGVINEISTGPGVLSMYRKWATVGTATKLYPRRQDLQTLRVFEEFVRKSDIPYSRVNYSFYAEFIDFLRVAKNYKENTVGTHIKNLKAVLNEAYKLKLHTNTDFERFAKPSEEVDNVFLSDSEVETIYKMKLPPMQDKVRDIFVLGCYVAQRHSDYSTVTKDDIKISL